MNTGVSYNKFYEILTNLREYFHSYGRIDDSNAKLDEITKLIAVSYSLAFRGVHFNLEYVKKKAKEYSRKTENVAVGLRKIFEEEVQQPMFLNEDGTNIFGAEPSLNIQPTENDLAEKLIFEISKIDFIELINEHQYSDFDLVNECFGHFIRDNFRNNKEDAQYMTPLEIVEPVLDVIFCDMEKEGVFDNIDLLENFTIMDPTCGVGTLLIQSANHFTKYITQRISDPMKCEDIIANFRACGMLGQDKVDRMIRLSKINALLLGGNISNINIGNSIIGESSISKSKGKIDFIFTNPPFGAEYLKEELELKEYPFLSKLFTNSDTYPSELLMLDKSLDLLKEGGYLAIILPDAVFSAKGIYAEYRDLIIGNVTIKGVFELPPVTFAQAGTRTNTCILYLKKEKPTEQKIYMSVCKDVGYVVKERGGAPIKIESGINEMLEIATIIQGDSGCNCILSVIPSVTHVDKSMLIGNCLNPTFYAADRLNIMIELEKEDNKHDIKKLCEVADIQTKKRKNYFVSERVRHISVLHINSNSTIDFEGVEKFKPICKGRECREGDVIFSKINPQISRIAVIPHSNYQLVCSNEFEIMRPKDGIDPYVLCQLLKTGIVKKQIVNLTSGTSSSHSRIKTEQLEDIKLCIEHELNSNMNKVGKDLKIAIEQIYSAEEVLRSSLKIMEKNE